MPELVLGPLLRYVSTTEATVWVETSERCEVEVLGRTEPTFGVAGHHYALARIDGLEPGSLHEYSVSLDGERCWPPAGGGLPPSTIRTLAAGRPFDVCFGSCRVALPHEEPYTLSKDEDERGRGLDALHVLATQMSRGERDQWPELLFLLGDQVYVDEGSPAVRARIRAQRDTGKPPGEEVANFEEYTWLYHESWQDPLLRWLLSVVSSSMQWDDHDVNDDWNISRSWVEDMCATDWWAERAIGAIMSYWVYQHLGNLSPHELDENDLYQRVRANPDAGSELRAWAEEIHSTGAGTRWSFRRDLDGTRAIFMDSRAGRVLDGERSIFDQEEWEWIAGSAGGDFDHLLIATTVPFLLSPAFHHLEAWNERVGDGAWGERAARRGERLRRALDFDHWAAFQASFAKMRNLLEEVGAGRRGRPPASITVLSGDVHHAYLCEVGFRRGSGVRSAVYQAVCSPYRNNLDRHERIAVRAGFTRPAAALARGLGRLAGVADPGIRWRLLEGPYFDNQVATLRLDGRSAELRLDKTLPHDEDPDALECSFERRLA
jgi:hypothetical protein